MIDERIKYWNSLFPEIENVDIIARIVLTITGKTIESYAEEYNSVQKELCNWICNEFFGDTLLRAEQCERYNDFASKYKWVGFFVPILKKHYMKYRRIIEKSKYIKNKEKFLDNFEDNVLEKMVNMSFRVLVLETQIAKNEGILEGSNGRQRGEYFCTHLLWDYSYIQELYCVYPELIRLLNQVLKELISYLAEILEDYKEISLHYGQLENIIWGKGDSHNKGKTVAILVCENGRIVYKPRSMVMEKKYSELLKWFSEMDEKFMEIASYNVYDLKFGSYMEFVENEACLTEKEVNKFYYRMGELLCILYTLNSKDFHCENIIARRDMPILIDLETLVHSTMIFYPDENIIYTAKDMISESVIGTALLPTLLQNSKTDDAIEIGGMGSGKKQKSPYKTQVIESFDTEDIYIRFENKELSQTMNFPKYGEMVISCANYLDTIKSGFQDTYTWICNNKKLYYQKIQSMFEDLQCRVICKSTNIYTQLLETGLHPDLLHNPYDRQIYLCRLGIIMEQNKEYDNYKIFQYEFEDMKEGDIPYFMTPCNASRVLHKSIEVPTNYRNRKSIIDSIKFKIDNMGTIDMDRQTALINQSFIGSKLISDAPVATGNHFCHGNRINELITPMEMGKKIGKLCVERGHFAKIQNEEKLTWIGMRGFGNGFYNIVPVGFGIYQGNAGIALFLYYLSLKEKKYLKSFHSAIEPVLSNLTMELEREVCLENIGAFTGFVSEIYCIVYLTKRKANVVSAQDLKYIVDKSMVIVKKNLEEECTLEFLSGLSGIIGVYLAAIPCLEMTQQKKVLTFVENLVKRLKNSVIEKEKGIYSWGNKGDIGYAHGNSGIITQLYKYYKVSQDIEILNLIKGTIKFERKYGFDEKRDRWIFRDNIHYYSWCNGIGGLLLTKIYLLNNGYKDDKLEDEIFKLVEQLIETGFGTDLSICHGDMGTLQLLMYAANVLENRTLREDCVNTINDIANNFISRNWKRIKEMEDWGIIAGLTGVGIGFIADNQDIIDMLLLE